MSRILPPDAPVRRMAEPPLLPISQAIGIARLVCILGVVYVHAWTGLGGDGLAAQAGSVQDVMRWTVVELFGRSAVPLLSIVSGWLVARSLAHREAGSFIEGKARTILLPMVLWNLLAMALVLAAGWLGLALAPLPEGGLWAVDNLLNLSRAGDVNVQTAFLRDLFLCMLAAPLLVRLRTRWLLLLIAGGALWAIGGWQLYLLLRPSILIFFAAGILARRHGLAERLGLLTPWIAALPFATIVPLKIWLSIQAEAAAGSAAHHVELVNAVDLLLRAAAGLLVWRAAVALARGPLCPRLLGFERYAFFLFCSHLIFMWLLAPAIGGATGPMGNPGWPLFFLAQPLLCLGFAMLLAIAIEAVSPRAARILSGGRLGSAQTASPAAAPLAQPHWKL